ncbi:hypothetical protein KY289_024821 [Solanum tuberosum]|nr:hypothetical protein KY289_024821 [Solanum tuberosum]
MDCAFLSHRFQSAVFNPMRSQSMHDEELPTGNQLTSDSGRISTSISELKPQTLSVLPIVTYRSEQSSSESTTGRWLIVVHYLTEKT